MPSGKYTSYTSCTTNHLMVLLVDLISKGTNSSPVTRWGTTADAVHCGQSIYPHPILYFRYSYIIIDVMDLSIGFTYSPKPFFNQSHKTRQMTAPPTHFVLPSLPKLSTHQSHDASIGKAICGNFTA